MPLVLSEGEDSWSEVQRVNSVQPAPDLSQEIGVKNGTTYIREALICWKRGHCPLVGRAGFQS